MNPDRWQQIRTLFDRAIAKEPEDRRRMLDDLAGTEPDVAAELQKLLEAHENADDFLEHPNPNPPSPTLTVGSVFAGRYQILQTLGEGGMGSVYKAFDQEVERLVALKVIRADLAGRPEIRERFRRELVFARKIVHRNVIRIFDLGVWENSRFITMEYVDGETLADRLHTVGRLAPAEAARIMLQVAEGLEAAHGQEVIHRDLKPQNILLDRQGRAVVMDFGIARDSYQSTLTSTRELIGTPDYMSPEQAKGEPAEASSDIFSYGVIFYELLLGSVPFTADNLMAALAKRTKEAAPAPATIDPATPAELSRIVERCLAIAPRSRYATASDLIADLRTWDKPALRTLPRTRTPVPLKWLAAAVAGAMLLGIGGFFLKQQLTGGPAGPQKTVTMLVADFENGTGDPEFDGTIEPVFSLAMEDSAFITTYSRGDALKAVPTVQPGGVRLTESAARLIAIREGIDVVMAGTILRRGDRFVVEVRPIDANTGKALDRQKAEAAGRSDLLTLVAKLATRIRRLLGDKTPDNQVSAAETFTAASIEAAHLYAKAQELALLGKKRDAIPAYKAAIQADPNMGRAYAGLGVVYRNLRMRDEALEAFKQALAHIDRMTERERLRTLGGYFVTDLNPQKAVEQFRLLIQKYPADTAGHANLALSSLYLRDLPTAVAEGKKAVQIYPRNLAQRNNVALYADYAGDFEAAAKEARGVIETDPSFGTAYLALALAELGSGRSAEAAQAYQELATLGEASVSNLGYADLALYEGRFAEGIELLKSGIQAERAAKGDNGAIKTAIMAQALLALGRKPAALAAADEAVKASQSESVLYSAAMVYAAAHAPAKAESLAVRLESRLGQEPRIYAKLIQGEVRLQAGDASGAVSLFNSAQAIVDTWLGHLHLGRAYLEANAFAEANSEFEACTRRRGEAAAVFLDDLPSYRYYPPVLYYRARAEEGLKSPGAADSYRKFLELRQKADAADALASDARRRLH